MLATLQYAAEDLDAIVVDVLGRAVEQADERQPGESWRQFVWSAAVRRLRLELAGQQRPTLMSYYRWLASHVSDDEACEAHFQAVRSRFSGCAKRVGQAEQQMLMLRYREGLDLRAIGQRMGRPIASVRRGLYRVRLRLAECMHDRRFDPSTMDLSRAQALTLKFIDDELSPRETEEMQWLVAKDGVERDRHVALLELEALLAALRNPSDVGERVVARFRGGEAGADGVDGGAGEVAEIAEAATSGGVGRSGRKRRRTRRKRRATLQLVLVTLILAGGVLAAYLFRDRFAAPAGPVRPADRATIVERVGQINFDRDGTTYYLRSSTALKPGDVVQVGDEARMTLAYGKGTRFWLGGGSTLRVDAVVGEAEGGEGEGAGPPRRRQLTLLSGEMVAELESAERELPVWVLTRDADCRAEAARYRVAALGDRTRVSASGGAVMVRRRSDNAVVELRAGQGVEVGSTLPMTPELIEASEFGAAGGQPRVFMP